jgi:hypothetical protein
MSDNSSDHFSFCVYVFVWGAPKKVLAITNLCGYFEGGLQLLLSTGASKI